MTFVITIPRLGINAYNVWGEALHGVVAIFNPNAGAAISFPSSASLGSSWDPLLMQREASVISDEARGFNSKVIANLIYCCSLFGERQPGRAFCSGEEQSDSGNQFEWNN